MLSDEQRVHTNVTRINREITHTRGYTRDDQGYKWVCVAPLLLSSDFSAEKPEERKQVRAF